MKHAELEGMAVAYSLIIMRGWPVQDTNARIIQEHGVNALKRVKRRAWQHVRANEPVQAGPAASHAPTGLKEGEQ